MTRKNTLTSLDSHRQYAVIGLDLAKYDVSVAAIPVDDLSPTLVDRMVYSDLMELASIVSPTLFVMEPCNGYSLLCLELQALGHETKVISGKAVSMWINTHMSGQKTDINDALALARLAFDCDLQPIREKTLQESRMMTLQATRRQLLTQRTKTLVCFKGLCQQWGIRLKVGSRSLKKMRLAVEAKTELLSESVVQALTQLLERIRDLDHQITELDKALQALLLQDERGQLLDKVFGISTQIAVRFITVVGDIRRFPNPRSLVAFIGCVPRNIITGHRNLPKLKKNDVPDLSHKGQGKISRHGDKYLRSLLIQGAAAIYMQYCKGQLKDCALKDWIKKQIDSRKPYGKILVSLAAKLIRIMWAVLTYKEKFDIEKAGVSRSVLASMEKKRHMDEAVESA